MRRSQVHAHVLALWAFVLALAALPALPASARQGGPLVPDSFTLQAAARQAIDAEWRTEAERRGLRLFHGVWEEADLQTPGERALVAINAWDLDHPVFALDETPRDLRAEAMLLRGEPQAALELLENMVTLRAARLRAEALEMLGRFDEADQSVNEPVRTLLRGRIDEPGELVDGVRALLVRARIQGQPARDFQTMMNLLGRARNELDRLHWPAVLAEAELLLEKDNPGEAIRSLHQALSLNPRAAEAWHRLGRMACERFDFDGASRAAEALRRLHPRHPLAELLLAESKLVQDDPDGALVHVQAVLARFPMMRQAIALEAAAHALRFDEASMRDALDRHDALSPGSAEPYHRVGRHLSFQRQYKAAADMLSEAIRRRPRWPAPLIEQGLMELQSGRDDVALALLRQTASLDPFNKRAANSLFLLEQLADFETVETEHFIIRFKPGIDRVMVEMMPEELERIHRTVAGRFQHEPDRKTIIELMPDHEWFAVRITGMPWIHTIAACTGPVIAMEVPREGPPSKHLGTFDWPRVLQHEYAHTITLSRTRNRVPHWLTEAAAVSMEEAPREYATVMQLARAYQLGELFTLDEINWAFIRPRRPQDRGLAYAQGHWMVEFMNERFGPEALNDLLDRYFDGEREAVAVPNALGVSREAFFDEFMRWAGEQVSAWGFAAEPTLEALQDELRQADPRLAEIMRTSSQARLDAIARVLSEMVGRPSSTDEQLTADRWPPLQRPPVEVSDDVLDAWIATYPGHPDLLELKIRRALAVTEVPSADLLPVLEAYAAARPADPYPHKVLIRHYLDHDQPDLALPHLEMLDATEQKSPIYAVTLRDLYRRHGDLPRALAKATRALHLNPYDARHREVAAEIALQTSNFHTARMHIVALTLLEPDRPQHERRLRAVEQLIARQTPQ